MKKLTINIEWLLIVIVLLFLFMWYLHSQAERRQRIIDAKIEMQIERYVEEKRNRLESKRVDNLVYNYYRWKK